MEERLIDTLDEYVRRDVLYYAALLGMQATLVRREVASSQLMVYLAVSLMTHFLKRYGPKSSRHLEQIRGRTKG